MEITRTTVTRQNFSADLDGGGSMTATINDGTIAIGLVQGDGARLQVAAMPTESLLEFLDFTNAVVAQAEGIPPRPEPQPEPEPEPAPEPVVEEVLDAPPVA